MPDWIGRTVSKVEIQKLLGRGGMAEVYLGRHTTLDRPVAVKVLFGHFSEDATLLARFEREARAVAAMRHPNIVQVFDFDVSEGRPYIVMELLPGPSLADYLAARRQPSAAVPRLLPPETTARLAAGIAAALDYAHARGIVHRDVKPSNVLLRREVGTIPLDEPLPADVEPVLTDFGVMHLAGGAGQRTATGELFGTPAYMSPEQARGDRVDARSDIYSFGVMLYELLAGHPPFDALTDTPVSLLLRHLTEPPPPLPNAGPALQAVLDRALAKDPALRYQRASDLAMDLRDAIMPAAALAPTRQSADLPTRVRSRPAPGAPILEPPSAAPPGAGLAPGPTGTDRAPAPVAVRPTAGGRRLPMLVMLSAVTLLALAGIALLGRNLLTPGATLTATPEGVPTAQPSPAGTASPHDGPTAIGGGANGPSFGTLRFHDTAHALDQATLAVAGLPPPPAGTQYEAWLLGEGGERRRSMGLLAVDAQGQATAELLDPDGANLLAQFDSFEITREPSPDNSPLPTGAVVYRDALAPQALVHVRHLLVAFPTAPHETALGRGLLDDAQFVQTYAQALLEAQQGNDLVRMHQDAEVLVNLIEGQNGADYKDHDGDGLRRDPSDGFGLLLNGKNLGYIQGSIEHARNAMRQPDAGPNVLVHGAHVITSTQNVAEWAISIRDLSLKLVGATDAAAMGEDARQVAALADRLLNGTDLNGNERIDPLPGEAGAKTAYEHMHYMADMFARPAEGSAPPPPTGLPVPGGSDYP